MEVNRLTDANTLTAGQVLLVPEAETGTAAESAPGSDDLSPGYPATGERAGCDQCC